MRLAFQIYRRLAETQPGIVPDARFFIAAVRVFSRTAGERAHLDKKASTQLQHEEGDQIEKLSATTAYKRYAGDISRMRERISISSKAAPTLQREDQYVLSIVLRDSINAGHPAPIVLSRTIKPARSGLFRLPYGSHAQRIEPQGMRKRPGLVNWTSPPKNDFKSMLYSLPRSKDRGQITRRGTAR